jgi:acetylornithine deacetylase/succinyl-diaminopimelate desuccinylase-like protein
MMARIEANREEPDGAREAREVRGALAAALACGLLATCAQARELRPRERLAREIYEQLIEIDTTHGSGSTTRAAEAMAKRLRAAGVPERDVRVLGPAERKGNLVARLRARGEPKQKPLLLLAHLDVVEAKRSDWSVDPFVLTERDGFFYGRGTIDDKAMAAIYVALAIELARERTPLSRDLILALTADEEGGGQNGARWLVAEHRELVDAGLVINEGGHGALRGGKRLYLALQAAEKTAMNFALTARDKGGHSSRPGPGNPIYRLARALARVEALVFPVQLNDVTRAYFERLARVERGEIAGAAAAIARNPRDAQAAAKLSAQPALNATLRTTCVATQISGGHAPNALPQEARVLVNCRALPGHAHAEIEAALRKAVDDPAVELTTLRERESAGPAHVDAQFLATVARISEALWPGVPVIPTLGTGATDSTYFRLAGIPAYGVSGLFDDLDDYRAHGRDERLGVAQFYDGLEFLRRLVRALAVTN